MRVPPTVLRQFHQPHGLDAIHPSQRLLVGVRHCRVSQVVKKPFRIREPCPSPVRPCKSNLVRSVPRLASGFASELTFKVLNGSDCCNILDLQRQSGAHPYAVKPWSAGVKAAARRIMASAPLASASQRVKPVVLRLPCCRFRFQPKASRCQGEAITDRA